MLCTIKSPINKHYFNQAIQAMTSLTKLLSALLLVIMASSWCLKTTVNYTAQVDKVDFSPDGTMIAVTSIANNQVKIYDTINFFNIYTHAPTTGVAQVARFSRNNAHLAVGKSNGEVQIFNLTTLPFSASLQDTYIPNQSSDIIVDMDFSYDNTMLGVCFSNDNQISVDYNWAVTGRINDKLNTGDTISACKWTPGNIFAVADTNKKVKSYPVTGGTIGAMADSDSGSVDFTDLAPRPVLSPIKIIASGGQNSQASSTIYISPSGGTQNTFTTAPTAPINTACYSGDGAYYAVAGDDMRIWVFDDATDTVSQELYDGMNAIQDCDFSSDGEFLMAATGLTSGNAYVYMYQKTCHFCDPGFYTNGMGTCAACPSAMTSCSMCYNSTYCVSCFQGYYLASSTTCTSCVSQMEGCSTCQSNSICVECNHGYYLNGGNTCSTCASLFPGCLACNSTNCFLCDNDYHISGSGCVLCGTTITQCLRCNSSSNCLQCATGSYVSGGGTACTACDTSCMVCSGASTTCSVCSRGFYLVGTTCTACSSNCLECSASACLECSQGLFISGTSCVQCDAPCSTCTTSSTNCLSCTVGFYFNTNVCTACTNNCSLCTDATTCTACIVGYYLTGSNTCLACAEQYDGCTQCELGSCLSCDQTSYLASATSCTVCNVAMSGCQSCNSSSDCSICAVGYYHTGTTGAGACSLCSAECQVCSSATVCSSCSIGYWLSTTTCTACSSPCTSCNSTGTECLSCQTGYFLNGNTCDSCTNLTNCLSCSSSTVCIGCISGFFASAGTCSSCAAGCISCNSTDCFSCNVGYYLSSPTVCSPCEGNCSTCSSASDCQTCNLGYYYDAALPSNQCVSCTSSDPLCIACNSTSCFICANGYFLNSGSCSTCSASVGFCSVCSGASNCTLCQDGYFLSSATACVSCSSLPGCLSCTNSTDCSLCASGYYLNGGSCSTCPGSCSACVSSTNCTICASSAYLSGVDCFSCEDVLVGCESCTDNTTCLSCGGGYLLAGSTCNPCSDTLPACSLCDNLGLCQSCQQGYFLNASNQCQLCSSSASLAGCLICNSSSSCQYCSSGYFLNGVICSLCSPSLPGCSQCADISTCLDCDSGYFLNTATNGCQLCQTTMSGCIFCSDNSTCLQCQGGYYLNGVTCSPCAEPGCQICNSTNPTNCITCNSGYFLSGFSCSTCPQVGCLDCNSSACLSCQSGYFLSAGACTLCSSTMSGCSKCSSNSVCTECESLFFLSSGSCSICSSTMVGCSFCTDNSTCLACDGGYFLNGSTCNPCSNIQGCLICNGSVSCLTCTAGYFEVNQTCSICSQSISNCFQCSNDSSCIACESGYQTTAAGTCQLMQISGGGSSNAGPSELAFQTFYVNASTLKHALSVADKSSSFQNIDQEDWPTVTNIYLETKSGKTQLTVLYVQLSSDLSTLFFFTNNPQSISSSQLPVANKGRILAGTSMQHTSMQAGISLPKSVINNVLPSVLLSSDLSMSNNLDDSTFYVSFVKESFSLYFSIFGTVVVSVLFVYGFLRAACLGMYSRNVELAGHCLALKTVSLVIFPTYAEYVNFCMGFMVVDLPWLNNLLPEVFANLYDVCPTGYLFFFNNMNLAAMHFFTVLIFISLLVMAYCCLSDKKENEIKIDDKEKTVVNFKFRAFKEFLLNFFGFGLAFAGFSSILGAFLNYASALTLSGLFYILGVILYGAIFSQAFAGLILSRRLCRIRIVLKATFLAGAGLNPLYLSSVAMIVDGLLMGIEYKLRRKHLICPKNWLASNIFILAALVCFYFIPDSFLTLGIVMVLVILAFVCQIYMFCCEKGLDHTKHIQLFEQEQNLVTEGHFWNLEQKNDSELNISEKEKDSVKGGSAKKQGDLGKDEFVFEVSDIDKNPANDTKTDKFTTINPFQPKRRTRKFKQAQQTSSSWNTSIVDKDDLVFEE